MADIKYCHCPHCEKKTAHEIYQDTSNYLHSLCTRCGKDVESRKRIKEICTCSTLECSHETDNTLQIKYIDVYGYIHWFCLSCGKDVESNKKVESC